MKKTIVFFSIFVIVISIFSVLSLAANTPKIYIEDVIKYDNKETVTVSIYMKDTNPDIVTLGLDLKYDTSKLEYVNSKAGKDLTATLKLDENMPEESKVAIAVLSISGLKKDGLYYQITFKVKDASQDIPLELLVKEATDSDGNDIKIETTNGKIVIATAEKEPVENKPIENKPVEKIEDFEVDKVDEITSIEDVISNVTKIEVGQDDVITYEVEDTDIVEILKDGTIIPNKNGTSKVRVKMNGKDIGTIEISVKDGLIEKITGKEEITKTVFKDKENKVSVEETKVQDTDKKTNQFYIMEIIVGVIIFIVLIIIKKK